MLTFDKKCAKCGTDQNLNTTLTVTIDDKKYETAFCTEHEDVSVKEAKLLITTKIKEFNDMREKMLKEFGIDISEQKSGIVQIEKKETPKLEVATSKLEVQAPKTHVVTEKKEVVLAGGKTGAIPSLKGVHGVAKGLVASVSVEQRSSVNVTEAMQREFTAAKKAGNIPADAKIVMPKSSVKQSQTVPGRCGAPMTIPRIIDHSTGGKTIINVVNTGGDQALQGRFKNMADSTKDSGFNYGRGFDVQTCPLCQGGGVTEINDETCPKCGGVGFLNKGWQQ